MVLDTINFYSTLDFKKLVNNIHKINQAYDDRIESLIFVTRKIMNNFFVLVTTY